MIKIFDKNVSLLLRIMQALLLVLIVYFLL